MSIPTKLYIYLRLHLDDLLQTRPIGKNPVRRFAAKNHVSATTSARLAQFLVANKAEIEAAALSGDWTSIEIQLFSPYGDYRLLPVYRRAIAQIAAGKLSPMNPPKKKGKRGRPLGSKNKKKPNPKSTFWQSVREFLWS